MVHLPPHCGPLPHARAEIVMALIGHAPDSDASVRDGISAALYDVGTRESLVPSLRSCRQEEARARPEFDSRVSDQESQGAPLLRPAADPHQAPTEHRVILLRVMHQILELKRDEIVADLALDLVGLAMSEMQREKVRLTSHDLSCPHAVCRRSSPSGRRRRRRSSCRWACASRSRSWRSS